MEQVRRGSLLERMKGAALLDIPTYEEVEADRAATAQAALVVGLVAVATAVAQARAGVSGAVAGAVSTYLAWAIWSGITYLIGTWLGGTATWGELLRTLGFAQTPGILLVLGIVPVLGGLAVLIAVVWMLIAGIIGIRQALDFSTGRAVLTAVLGFIPWIIAMAAISAVLGVPGRGL